MNFPALKISRRINNLTSSDFKSINVQSTEIEAKIHWHLSWRYFTYSHIAHPRWLRFYENANACVCVCFCRSRKFFSWQYHFEAQSTFNWRMPDDPSNLACCIKAVASLFFSSSNSIVEHWFCSFQRLRQGAHHRFQPVYSVYLHTFSIQNIIKSTNWKFMMNECGRKYFFFSNLIRTEIYVWHAVFSSFEMKKWKIWIDSETVYFCTWNAMNQPMCWNSDNMFFFRELAFFIRHKLCVTHFGWIIVSHRYTEDDFVFFRNDTFYGNSVVAIQFYGYISFTKPTLKLL